MNQSYWRTVLLVSLWQVSASICFVVAVVFVLFYRGADNSEAAGTSDNWLAIFESRRDTACNRERTK